MNDESMTYRQMILSMETKLEWFNLHQNSHMQIVNY